MSTFTSQWDPEKVLGIGEVSLGITCVGHAHSENRRCHNAIAAVNRERASNLLQEMSRMEVLWPRLEKSLKELARFLLYKRQHQNQLPSVLEKWRNLIERFQVQEAANQDIITELDHVIRSTPAAAHHWTAQLEQSLLHGNNAQIQKTIKLLDLAQERERSFQAQLTDLQTSNADLHREVDSLRTQLAHPANDSVHNRASPITTLSRARQPSTDSQYATFTHQISAEGGSDRQPLNRHGLNHIHLIRFQFELHRESVSISQRRHPQLVSLLARSSFHPSIIL